MTEIDPVILRLMADTTKYQAELKASTRTVDQQLGTQQKRVRMLEKQFSQSSGQISTTIKRLAGTLAAAFSARELIGLADSFTRLQNNLRVAGLEGQALADVQARLLGISQQYGVELESLTSVFLKASLVQKDLGVSTEEIIRLNEITAASLKITGTSAAEAQGALLQLGQALGSGVVRAEEFNSILEGALPLAQAAARGIDGFGGSVSKLRTAIADGQITSKQFFEGVLKGGVQTLADAEKATLTLAGGFTALTSALTVYVGEADKANGVSAALGEALGRAADNLDILIPAIAAVSVGLGVGFATNAARARLAAIALSTGAAGASVSLGTLAVAARGAGAALLGAFGGPIGLAITAVALALTYVASESAKAAAETDRLKKAAEENAVIFLDLGDAAKTAARETDNLSVEQVAAAATAAGLSIEVDKLADAHYRAAVAARTQRIEEHRLAIGVFAKEANAKADALKNQARISGPGDVNQRGTVNASLGKFTVETAKEFLASGQYKDFRTAKDAYKAMIDAPLGDGASTRSSGGGSSKKSKTRKSTRSGPSPAEIASRHADDLNRLKQEEIQAQIQITDDAEERANLASDLLVLEFSNRKKQIDENADLNDTQKAAQIAILEKLYGIETKYNDQNEIVLSANNALYQQGIERERSAQTERDTADLADERYRAEDDQRRLQLDLASTQAERRDIALKILAAEDEYLKSKLQAVIDSNVAGSIEKQRAEIALASLNATAGARREATARQNEGALARYARGTQDVDARIEEITVRKIQDINDTIANTLADELGIKDKFIRDLLTVFLDKAIFGPLADSLSGAGGGGGGLDFGSIISGIGAIFGGGRASGGPVTGGKVYRVNEGAGAGRVEGFAPTGSGKIIPLGQMNAMQQSGGRGTGGVVTVRLALSGDIEATIDQRSAAVAVEVTRAAAPEIVKASVSETFRQGGRQSL